jgi:putative component of membrane protein insertase Oxa1/YidC/SpoIIIJ protein YidD
MIDNLLPIPEAGFLPLYRMVLMLACVFNLTCSAYYVNIVSI